MIPGYAGVPHAMIHKIVTGLTFPYPRVGSNIGVCVVV